MKKYIVTESFTGLTEAKKREILTTNDLDDFERLYNSKGKWVCDVHSMYGEAYCKPYEEQNYPTRNYNIDIEPFTYTYVYKENGNITDVISYTSQKELVKVSINKGVTAVIFEDGSKGIAKCDPEDKYDIQKGIGIAYYRARIEQMQNKLKEIYS